MGEGLVVTDSRVMIIKAGSVTGAGLFGARCKTFRFGDISSVDLRVGPMGGHLQVSVAGTSEVKDRGSLDMAKAENAVTFVSTYKNEMKEIAAYLNSVIAQRHERAAGAPSGIADQLQKLGDLKAAGVLDEAEFVAAKRKLLE
jgi:hypothetical protein